MRLIISGTPVQNNLMELHALYDFCCEGLLGDAREFKAMYERPITQGALQQQQQKQQCCCGGMHYDGLTPVMNYAACMATGTSSARDVQLLPSGCSSSSLCN
jgi:hypothetical protein